MRTGGRCFGGARRHGLTLHAPLHVRAGSLVSFRGEAGRLAGVPVRIQKRVGRGWVTVVSGHSSRRGSFELTWAAPARRGLVVVRAVVGGRLHAISPVRTIRVLALAKGQSPIVPARTTEVLSPAAVSSAPAPGTAGTLVYSGGNDAQVGSIIAIGAGPNTPDGFLGRVTSVHQEGVRTVVSTVPATLLEAVPNGSLDLTAASTTAAVASAPREHPRATVTCAGSAGASITQSVSFSAGITLKGSWSWLHGLTSASLTADASANASVPAVLQAAGS